MRSSMRSPRWQKFRTLSSNGTRRRSIDAWEVNYQRDEDARVLIMARAVREQLEQCVTEMRAIVGRPCNGDGDDSRVDAHSLMSIRALIRAGLNEPSS